MKSLKEEKNFQSLKKSTWFYILLASTVLTAFFTLVSTALDYSSNIAKQEDRIKEIQNTYLESLGSALWDLNDEQLEKQLKGIVTNKDILEATVSELDGEGEWSHKNAHQLNLYTYHLDFLIENNGKKIGSLHMKVTKYYIIEEVKNYLIRFFIFQGIKTFIASFVILFILESLITRHVIYMASYLRSYDPREKPSFAFDRPPKSDSDELTELEKSFNSLLLKQYEDLKASENLVEEHKEMSIRSSKLAELGTMAAGVGHEINNPLAISVGNLNIIKKAVAKDEIDFKKVEHSINKIVLANERIKKIVDGLRVYARLDNDNNEKISLNEVVIQTVDLITDIYGSEGVVLSLELPKDDYIINGNFGRLQQVLMNIISNAKDASENNIGERAIEVFIEEGQDNIIILSVKDNGSGIEPDILDKILNPFFTTKEVGKGTGIGLGVVTEIIKKFKGDLRIDSTLGKGTTFYIDLPIHEIASPMQKQVEMDDTNVVSLNSDNTKNKKLSGKVLLVDDEEDIRDLTEGFLEEMGLDIEIADDGTKGLEKIKEFHYDFVITDMKMPKMNGDQMIKEAQQFCLETTKFVVVTGGVDVNQLDSVRDIILGSIDKPFTYETLYKLLSSSIDEEELKEA